MIAACLVGSEMCIRDRNYREGKTEVNWLLICVIGILVVCALEGYFRGFIKIVFSLLAMIITLAVVSVAAPKITTYIEENTELDERSTEKCLEHVEKNAQDRLNR